MYKHTVLYKSSNQIQCILGKNLKTKAFLSGCNSYSSVMSTLTYCGSVPFCSQQVSYMKRLVSALPLIFLSWTVPLIIFTSHLGVGPKMADYNLDSLRFIRWVRLK